jgi:hypothetical protein
VKKLVFCQAYVSPLHITLTATDSRKSVLQKNVLVASAIEIVLIEGVGLPSLNAYDTADGIGFRKSCLENINLIRSRNEFYLRGQFHALSLLKDTQ